MFTRRRRLLVTRVVLAALLFVQGMLVVQACLLPEATLPAPVANVEHSSSDQACEQSGTMDDNACLANYIRDSQGTTPSSYLTIDALPVVIATLAPAEDRAPVRVAHWLTHSSPSQPPPSLRFVSLQL